MKLIWLDLETSGLDPHRHAVLEAAVGFADLAAPFELKTMDRFVLRFTGEHTHGLGCTARQRPTDAAVQRFLAMGTPADGPCPACDFDPVAREMHQKSGLLAECASSSTTMGDVEDYLLTLVHGEPERGDDKPTVAGSTVHFDLGFLRAHAPRFVARVSHRCYDVSAIKLFCESLGMPRIPKVKAHRAEADIHESIQHARQCVGYLLGLRDSSSIRSLLSDMKRLQQEFLSPPESVYVGPGSQLRDVGPCVEPVTREATVRYSTVRNDRNPSGIEMLPDGSIHDYRPKERTESPDAHCVTTGDGGCASTDPRDVHRVPDCGDEESAHRVPECDG